MKLHPHYPDSVHFKGLNTPRRLEASAFNVYVEGEIPEDIDGVFYRAVPDAAWPPEHENPVILDADGQIHAIDIRKGRVDTSVKYVKTERFLAEMKAGKGLFGRYHNPYTDDPSVKDVDRTVANTTPYFHAGKLVMSKEDGIGYEMHPHTLETLGRYNFDGKLKMKKMLAHPRFDPDTGDFFQAGYEVDELGSNTMAYVHISPDGKLLKEQWFKAPYAALMHDFVTTKEHAVFPVFPTISDDARMREGGAHWHHHQDEDSWIGVMPREGDVEDMTWIKGPKGVHAYHHINAYTEGNMIYLDMCLARTNMIPFINQDSGNDIEFSGDVVRWHINLDTKTIEEQVLGPFGEVPRICDKDYGKKYTRGWYLTLDFDMAPMLHNGPTGMHFNAIARVNFPDGNSEGASVDITSFEPGLGINEPVHVESSKEGHGGYLMFMVDREPKPELEPKLYTHELWIMEADDLNKPPLAKIFMPFTLREQVHGNWVSRERLEQFKG